MTSIPAKNPLLELFLNIFAYREYLKQSVLRDLRNKYKRSVLGYFWSMVHPLAMMTILALVFSHIMRVPTKDFAIFLFCGLLPWNYFSSTVMMSMSSIRQNAKLFGQVAVPKYIFILSLCCSNLFNLFVALIPLTILSFVFGKGLPLTALSFPIFLLPMIFTTLGIALIVATSAVFFDDTLHLTEVALQGLYFLCPILYDRSLLPVEVVRWLSLNPLFSHIEVIRAVLYAGQIPDLQSIVYSFGTSILILVIGLFAFNRSQDKFLYFV